MPANNGSSNFVISGSVEVGETLSLIETNSDPDGRTDDLSIVWQSSTDGVSWSDVGSNSTFNIYSSSLSIGNQLIYSGGKINAKYNEEIMRNYMKNHTIKIEISLNSGTKSFKAYTCDLTHDYISINANYRN